MSLKISALFVPRTLHDVTMSPRFSITNLPPQPPPVNRFEPKRYIITELELEVEVPRAPVLEILIVVIFWALQAITDCIRAGPE